MFRISRLLFLGVVAALPASGAQRAFVASYGSDANQASGCLLANPCRGFQAAHNVVDDGGEIIALDTAGYAAVAITKSVSIIGSLGSYAGISVPSGVGVTIATPGVKVVLRGLNINGVGGASGIAMTDGDRLRVENCIVSGFNSHGIVVDAPARVSVVDSNLRDNAGRGIWVRRANAEIVRSQALGNGGTGFYVSNDVLDGSTFVSIEDSVTSGNSYGVFVQGVTGTARVMATRVVSTANVNGGFVTATSDATATAIMTVGYSTAAGNNVGMNNFGGAGTTTLESLGNNLVRQNASNPTGGTITVVAGT